MFDGMPEHRAVARAGINGRFERRGHARSIGERARSSKCKVAAGSNEMPGESGPSINTAA